MYFCKVLGREQVCLCLEDKDSFMVKVTCELGLGECLRAHQEEKTGKI